MGRSDAENRRPRRGREILAGFKYGKSLAHPMHRVTRATLGTVAIGLVAVFMVVGLVGASFSGQLHSMAGQTAKPSAVAPVAKSQAPVSTKASAHPSAVTLTTKFTAPSPWPAYNLLPLEVNFSITVTGAVISAANTTVLVNVSDYTVTSGYPLYLPTLITSTMMSVKTSQVSYTFNVTHSTLLCNNNACTGLAQDEYGVSVFVGVVNGTASNNTTMTKTFFVITTPLVASLISPTPGAAVSVGNVTISVAYLGSWIAGAQMSLVYTATGVTVFSKSFVELTPGIPVTATWYVGQVGTYNYSIDITTVYAPNSHYYNGTLTVITKGGTVYQNLSKWSNTTLISGLSGAAAGTMLLVVGLIVGMIVALVLARAVMGRPAQAPPQPWESKPGTAAAAPNTCSVCGKSFATPEELAAHGKSEHGMQ